MPTRSPHSRRRADERRPASPDTHAIERATRPAGQPLPAGVRAQLEPRFGHSFEQVRVHADTSADALLAPLGSPAAMVDGDIYVTPAQYAPDTPAGRFLLAHELTHVVQARTGGVNGDEAASRPGDAAEREATAAAAAALSGLDVAPPTSSVAPVAAFSLDPSTLWNTITDNSLSGAVGMATEMSKTAASPIARGLGMVDEYGREISKVAGESSGIPMLGRLLGPLGLISNADSMVTAAGKGGAQGVGDFLGAATGFAGSIAPTLELGAMGAQGLGLGGAAAGLEGAAAALGPVGAVAGSFAGGYTLGSHLYNHTSVGDRSQDSLGWLDSMLTDEGEQSWMLTQSEEFDQAWEDNDVLGVIGNGLQIGAAGTAGAIGGLAGGIGDAAGAAYDWLTDW
jgi:hypothetical protein